MFRIFAKQHHRPEASTLGELYSQLLSDAMRAQRAGDIECYCRLTQEAERVLEKIEIHDMAMNRR